MNKPKPNTRYKSAETGRFVKKAFAMLNKATTYLTTLAPRKKKNKEIQG